MSWMRRAGRPTYEEMKAGEVMQELMAESTADLLLSVAVPHRVVNFDVTRYITTRFVVAPGRAREADMSPSLDLSQMIDERPWLERGDARYIHAHSQLRLNAPTASAECIDALSRAKAAVVTHPCLKIIHLATKAIHELLPIFRTWGSALEAQGRTVEFEVQCQRVLSLTDEDFEAAVLSWGEHHDRPNDDDDAHDLHEGHCPSNPNAPAQSSAGAGGLKLVTLDIEGTDAAGKFLRALVKSDVPLQLLNLCGCSVPPDAPAWADLHRVRTITDLDLGWLDLGTTAASALSALPLLRRLSLDNVLLSKRGFLIDLASAPPPQLAVLNLSWTDITPSKQRNQADLLVELAKITSLTDLDLSFVTGVGSSDASALLQLERLVRLDLSESDVTKSQLETVVTHQTLRALAVGGRKVSSSELL